MTSSNLVHESRGPRLSSARIAEFEAKIGHRLPGDYRTYLQELNGGTTTPYRFSFGRQGWTDRTSLNCLLGLDREDDGDGGLNLEERWELSRTWLPPEGLSVGSDDGGNTVVLVIDGAHAGEVWFLLADERPEGSNPRVSWYDRRDVCKLAPSFTAFLEMLQP